MPTLRPIIPALLTLALIPGARAQVVEVDASRSISIEIDGADPVQQSAFGFGIFDEGDDLAGLPNGGRTAGSASQRSTVSPSLYTGELAASAESVLALNFSTANAEASASCVILFEATELIEVISRIELDASALDAGQPEAFVLLGNPDDEGLYLNLTLAAPTAEPIVDNRRIQLPPGLYAFNARVRASTTRDALAGGETAEASATFNLRLRARPCLCERAGDPDEVDVLDLLDFVDRWLANDLDADLDDSESIGIIDLLLFLECWLPASVSSC